jgi:acetyl esterase/lipase
MNFKLERKESTEATNHRRLSELVSDILDRISPPRGKVIYYGRDSQQFAELRFPSGEGPFPLLFVIHGGFWLAAYDLQHISHLCVELTSRGIATCNIEYRRVGQEGGGWPGTFLDVAEAVEYFGKWMSRERKVDMTRAAVMGHSAGGHLALWLGGRHRLPKTSVLYGDQKPWLIPVISLAGVSDLRTAWSLHLGSGAVERLIGGSPDRYPERYSEASPIELLPMGLRLILIHGLEDDRVPIVQSERFIQSAKAAGDKASLISLDGVGHFELIDPESKAWDAVAGSVFEVLGAR